MLITTPGVEVVVAAASSVPAGSVWPGTASEPVAGCWSSGQAIRSIGTSVQVLTSVQTLSVRGVVSGPLQSTICWPLFTSTVEQLGVVSAVVDVVVAGAGETIPAQATGGNAIQAQ